MKKLIFILTIILLSTTLSDAQEFWMSLSTPSFTCGDALFDSRDGNTYTTVQIGTQCWMKQNMAYLPQVDAVADGSENDPTATPGKYYYVYGYDGTDVNAAKTFQFGNPPVIIYNEYGVLYNWTAAMDDILSSPFNPSGVQGVCPAGWHLPSDAEWKQITTYLGGESVAGVKMKETGTTHWVSQSAGTDNSSYFTGLPGGFRNYQFNSFIYMGETGYFWSSTEYNPYDIWFHALSHYYAGVSRFYFDKSCGLSVRCVKDN